MTAIKTIEKINKINDDEFLQVNNKVFQFFIVDNKNQKSATLEKKDELLAFYADLLKKCLEMNLPESKQDKLTFINFIDKLNMQRKLLEVMLDKKKATQLQMVSKRFGRKAQSAFRKNTAGN